MDVVADDAGDTTEIRTFLIADVRGYTRYTQERGDEAAARLAARFAEVVAEVVAGRDGRVVELRGDEVLCVFGSARGALRAAVDLQRRCADELRADPSVPLRVGVGIDAGEAVAVAGGYRGGALNLAARLCSIAGPGEVLVSEGVVHLARHVDEMSYLDRGRVELKGMDEPVHVMELSFDLDMPEVAGVGGRRWTRERLAALAAGIIMVVALVVVVAAMHIDGGHAVVSLRTNVVGFADASGRILGQVPLGGRPGGVAVGANSVWATDTEHDSVVQINAAGRKVDTIPVGLDPTGVAVGGGGVWVADSGSGTVSWVSASSPGQSTPIPVGQGPGAIAFGMGFAWVVNATDGTLQRIDAKLRPSVATAIGGAPAAVTVGDDWVWVTDTSSSSVVKIDPHTLHVVARLPVGNNPVAAAFGAHRVWVANAADGTVTSIDPATNQARQILVGGDPVGVAYTSGALWVAVGQPPSLVRIDTRSLQVDDSTPTDSVPQAVAASADRTWLTALVPPRIHRGGTLTIVAKNDVFGGFFPPDPARPIFVAHWQVLSLTNDGLVTYRRVGGPAGAQVVPDLAVSMPTVTDGGRTYTFQLRRGIRYSNGQHVRASDFRYAVQRQFRYNAKASAANGCCYFQDVAFSGLVGYGACEGAPITCSLVDAIETDNGAGTITIHLSHPDPALPQKLATTVGALVPPGSPPPGSGKPVPATGPYMISSYSNKGLLLVRNPYFRQWSADAQPAGYPDKLRWSYLKDENSELSAVEQGNADTMVDSPPPNRVGELQTRYAALAHPYANLTTTYVDINTRAAPFDQLDVRRALNLAIDRDRAAKLLGGPELQVPTCQVLPPGIPGYAPYCPYTVDPTPGGVWSGPDVGRAQELVRASGTRGAPVTLWVRAGYPPNVAVGRYLATVLRQIGYPTTVHLAESPDFFPAVADPHMRIQVSLAGGWLADYPSPIDFFDILLTCRTAAGLNVDKFCDPRFDSLVHAADAAQATDPTRALELWQEADREAVNQAPWVPLTNNLGLHVVSARVGNYQHNPQWGILLDQLWVK